MTKDFTPFTPSSPKHPARNKKGPSKTPDGPKIKGPWVQSPMALLLNDLTESKRMGAWLYRHKNQNSQTPSCSLNPFSSPSSNYLVSIIKNISQGQEVDPNSDLRNCHCE
jgi:hypothetical protein